MARKIVKEVSADQLFSDLERYRQEAIYLGASDARVIEAKDVIIDERVVAKCFYPKCPFFGTNANCPPYALKPEEMTKIVNRYRYGILFTLQAPSSAFVGPFEVLKAKGETAVHRKKVFEIAAKLESAAFYDGYHFALGFGSGPCKALFCENTECTALQPGKACRAPLRGRSPMEAVGMDVFGMSVRMGWDIYPCGASLSPEDVPFGRRLGMVFVY